MSEHRKPASSSFDLDSAIRKIKDFPKPGILFYDITSILMNPEAFGYCVDRMLEHYGNRDLSAVAAIESRDFSLRHPLRTD